VEERVCVGNWAGRSQGVTRKIVVEGVWNIMQSVKVEGNVREKIVNEG
jgi:hypothetical protein